MISLHMLYGFGGLCAVMLLAYLVYALICAARGHQDAGQQ